MPFWFSASLFSAGATLISIFSLSFVNRRSIRESVARRNSVNGLLRILRELRAESSQRDSELAFEILRMLYLDSNNFDVPSLN